ncbi:MAG: hypothetical protein QOF65_2428 [Thermoleophilaceae bacterium]|jgi:hypothetical protein|nr:hypothetical protein [Thermoleophilaceae bacterium]MEA2437872.1 hypothetical protein [Thermoleophilaceae bacterium]
MGGAHPDTTGAVLAALAVGSVAAGTVSLVWVHFLRSGHRPLVDAVSDYGASPYRLFYRVTVVALGLGALLLLLALAHGSDAPSGALIWLGVFAASRIAIAFFPTDLQGKPVTPTGRVHLLLAAAAFAAIAFAAADLTPWLRGNPPWDDVGGLADALRWAVVVTAIATGVTSVVPQLRKTAFGLVERLLYVAMIAFLLTVSIEAVRVLG